MPQEEQTTLSRLSHFSLRCTSFSVRGWLHNSNGVGPLMYIEGQEKIYHVNLNRVCKGAISGFGANISDKSIQRMGKCLRELEEITHNYDTGNCIPSESGKHAGKSEKDDRIKILDQLNDMKVITHNPWKKTCQLPQISCQPSQIAFN